MGQRRVQRRVPRIRRRLCRCLQLALHRHQLARLCLPRLPWKDQPARLQLDAVPRIPRRRRRKRRGDRHRELEEGVQE